MMLGLGCAVVSAFLATASLLDGLSQTLLSATFGGLAIICFGAAIWSELMAMAERSPGRRRKKARREWQTYLRRQSMPTYIIEAERRSVRRKQLRSGEDDR